MAARNTQHAIRNTRYATRFTFYVLRSTSHAPRPSRGFTLVELLVVIGILSLVIGVLAAVLLQFMDVTRAGNGQMTVDGDMRNAGLWLMRDGSESQVFTGTVGCNTFVFDTGSTHGDVYTYTLSGTTLQRDDGSTTRRVARHVDDVDCPAGTITGTVGITLLSVSDGVSASQTFTMALRVR